MPMTDKCFGIVLGITKNGKLDENVGELIREKKIKPTIVVAIDTKLRLADKQPQFVNHFHQKGSKLPDLKSDNLPV